MRHCCGYRLPATSKEKLVMSKKICPQYQKFNSSLKKPPLKMLTV
jgi:hypothetical protein